jgi:hypothetical protein
MPGVSVSLKERKRRETKAPARRDFAEKHTEEGWTHQVHKDNYL